MLDPNPRVCLRPRRAACHRQLSILSIFDGSQPGQGEAWAHLSRARVGGRGRWYGVIILVCACVCCCLKKTNWKLEITVNRLGRAINRDCVVEMPTKEQRTRAGNSMERATRFWLCPGTGSHYPLPASVPTPVPCPYPYPVPVRLRTAPALTQRESAAALPGPTEAEAEAGTEALEAQSAPICWFVLKSE